MLREDNVADASQVQRAFKGFGGFLLNEYVRKCSGRSSASSRLLLSPRKDNHKRYEDSLAEIAHDLRFGQLNI